MAVLTPRNAFSSVSTDSAFIVGLRPGSSCTVVVHSTVPSPSTWMPPPSFTIDELNSSAPARPAMNAPTCCSSVQSLNPASPHALNFQWVAPRRPSGWVRKVGPLSRAHESPMGVSWISINSSTIARAMSPSPMLHTSDTGSKRAMVFATLAHTSRTVPNHPSLPSPKPSLTGGNSIQVRSCGAHSGGIEKPARRGVVIGVAPSSRARSVVRDQRK